MLHTLDLSERPYPYADRESAAMMSSYWATSQKKRWATKNAPVPEAGTAARSALWEMVLIR